MDSNMITPWNSDYIALKDEWKQAVKELDNQNQTINILIGAVALLSFLLSVMVAGVIAQFYGGYGF